MNRKGYKSEDVLSILSKYRADDIQYNHVLCSMCTTPHPITIKVHEMFCETNLGDPGLFPGTTKIEELLIESIGSLMHHKDAGGYATSGGTESNLQAIRIAKKLKADVKKPNIVVPESAHFSFDKACDIFNIEMRTAPYQSGYTVDTDKMAELIDKNTIAIVAVAGSTEYGTVDNVPAIAKIAMDNDLFCHVDAAFGGLVIPFLPKPIPFDFSIPGVSSISVDPHKMGFSTIPCGCLLLRDKEQLGCLNVDTPYLTVKQECTLSGTRPGADVACAYAVLLHLGLEGLGDIVAGCMENTRRIVAGMETFGYSKIIDPIMNVVTFSGDYSKIPKKWHVSYTRFGHLRLVIMPHVTRDVVEEFLKDCSIIS